jgi:hypothetical protein
MNVIATKASHLRFLIEALKLGDQNPRAAADHLVHETALSKYPSAHTFESSSFSAPTYNLATNSSKEVIDLKRKNELLTVKLHKHDQQLLLQLAELAKAKTTQERLLQENLKAKDDASRTSLYLACLQQDIALLKSTIASGGEVSEFRDREFTRFEEEMRRGDDKVASMQRELDHMKRNFLILTEAHESRRLQEELSRKTIFCLEGELSVVKRQLLQIGKQLEVTEGQLFESRDQCKLNLKHLSSLRHSLAEASDVVSEMKAAVIVTKATPCQLDPLGDREKPLSDCVSSDLLAAHSRHVSSSLPLEKSAAIIEDDHGTINSMAGEGGTKRQRGDAEVCHHCHQAPFGLMFVCSVCHVSRYHSSCAKKMVGGAAAFSRADFKCSTCEEGMP